MLSNSSYPVICDFNFNITTDMMTCRSFSSSGRGWLYNKTVDYLQVQRWWSSSELVMGDTINFQYNTILITAHASIDSIDYYFWVINNALNESVSMSFFFFEKYIMWLCLEIKALFLLCNTILGQMLAAPVDCSILISIVCTTVTCELRTYSLHTCECKLCMCR